MEIVTLAQVCDIQVGKTPSRNNKTYWGEGALWLSIADMNQGSELSKTKETITQKAIQECNCKLIPPGTVLFSFKLSIGKVGVNKVPMYTNEAIAAFIIKNDAKLNTKFLYYVLKSVDHNIGSNRAVMGKTLNKKQLEQIKIPLPPLEEQKRIVRILDQADTLRQKRRKSISLLDDYLKAMFLEMFGDPVKNPKKYSIQTIDDVAVKEKNGIKAGPFGSSLKKEFYVKSGYKIYGQEQVIKDDFNYGDYYVNEERYQTLESCKIQQGDILISLVGTFGKISVVPEKFEPGIINPRLMKITPNQNIILPLFLKELLVSQSVQKQIKDLSHGGTMGIVNVGIIKKIKILVPSLDEQKVYLGLKEKLEIIKESMLTQSAKLENQFQTLIQGAFNQKLNHE